MNKVPPLVSTAYWIAAVRAQETHWSDRLFEDPWAEGLAGEIGKARIQDKTPESVTPITLRTPYFDDILSQVSRETEIRQLVLVAPGLDVRAYRLTWQPGTIIFELDRCEVLEYKAKILSEAMGAPWIGTLDDPLEFLAKLG